VEQLQPRVLDSKTARVLMRGELHDARPGPWTPARTL